MTAPKEHHHYDLFIDGYSAQGDGVGRIGGMAVFVKGALRGETCRVFITKVGRSAAWGETERVLTPSPERVEPGCPYFSLCGGCALRHMTYAEELRLKREKVEEDLHRLGGLDLPVPVIHGAAQTDRYRNKAQFPVSGTNGIAVGFYRQRTHQVTDVPSCLLLRPQADAAGRALKAWMERWAVPAYDERTHTGLVRHLYVRTNRAGESLICVLCNGDALPREEQLVEELRRAVPECVGVLLGVNREKTNVILGKQYRTLWGRDTITDTLCGLEFQLSVPSFFQVNRDQAEVLYERALDFAGLTGRETVLDLYCGTGTISLVMAQRAARVIGAEIVPAAVDNARANAKGNQIHNAEFLLADAGDAAADLAARGVRPDVVCVDPPRKGMAQEVLAHIVSMQPSRVVYVSCDPATLARDLGRFAQLGYRAERAEAVDMFPRTWAVETVVLLLKG